MADSGFGELAEAGFPADGAGDLIEKAGTNFGFGGGGASEKIGGNRNGGGMNFCVAEGEGKARAGGLHERGVVGPSDFEGNGPFDACGFGGVLGSSEFGSWACEDDLSATV